MKNRRRFTITVGAVLMVCMLATGYAAVAAEYGESDGSLISQDYLEQVFTPSLLAGKGQASSIAEKITELSQMLDYKIAALLDEAGDASAEKPAGSDSVEEGENWETITVAPGKTLKLHVNTEFVLQKGGGTCVESAGTGLIDQSSGGVLSADEALKVDHRYLATTKNAGFRATSASTVRILGGYTLA
ncbi:MAG: hypothetical protein J6L72_05650 [Butyricicoccus sp.]|nr:hypothetical protein [Butyricicoccus sp.]